jgi:hypothetical protein
VEIVGGGNVVVDEEVTYVTEDEVGYRPGTVTNVEYIDEEVVKVGDGTQVVTINRDEYPDGQDVVILDGKEVAIDNNGRAGDVTVVVNGDYDYGINGEEQETVLIFDDGTKGSPRDTICCGCPTVINNNNYNYFNQGGVPGYGYGYGNNRPHQNTKVIHKYPNGRPVRPVNHVGRRVIKRIGNKQRIVNTGNGARRRLYTRKILPRNLGVASGTNNVQVHRVLDIGDNKKQLVTNLRKRPMQVFKVQPGSHHRSNTVPFRKVPKWKGTRMQSLGVGVKIGQEQQRKVGRPSSSKMQKNQLRFNNKVMPMNKKTGKQFGLQNLELGLQNRLGKHRVVTRNSKPSFARKCE